jgi:hypothetical protein
VHRRVQQQLTTDGGDFQAPAIQLRQVEVPAAPSELQRSDLTYDIQVAQPKAAEPLGAVRKVSLTSSFTQTRMARQEAHDEVMKIFETL